MFRLAILLIMLLVVIGTNGVAVMAQEPIKWAHDQQVPDYLNDTFTPYLVADQNNTVHAFANQWVGEDNDQLAVIYRQWSLAGGWTKPIDILLSPEGRVEILGAFLDPTGLMHVIFWGGMDDGASIYYSSAPASDAGRAPAWLEPEAIGEGAISPVGGALAGDDQGNLFAIYTGNSQGNGVYAIHSTDAGQSWSEPVAVFLTYDPELTPYSLRLYMGKSGQLHAAWNVVTSKGIDASAYYARYDIAQAQWNDLVMLETRIDKEGYFGPSFPAIAENGNTVVVMYNGANPFTGGYVDVGRPMQRVRLSYDGGQTWREATQPFPWHQGRSGEHALVVDSNNSVHAIFIQRIDQVVNGEYGSIGGIWHSELRGGQWDNPDRFITTYAPHDARAVISQGNVLLVVWREDPGAEQVHGVWYSYTTLNAPELPAVPLPTPSATPTATPSPTVTPALPASTPSPKRLVAGQGDTSSGVTNNPAGPFILGIIPVILGLTGVILVYQLIHSRRY